MKFFRQAALCAAILGSLAGVGANMIRNFCHAAVTVIALFFAFVGTASAQSPWGNPQSTLTMTSATTAYTTNQLIANNATAASVVNPTFAILNSYKGGAIPRLRLSVNDATSTAWGGQTIQVDLWTASPTWTNGDRGTWAVATGSASHIASYTCALGSVNGDGVYGECSISTGNFSVESPPAGNGTIYWSLKAVTGSGVTGASKIWTLTAETVN